MTPRTQTRPLDDKALWRRRLARTHPDADTVNDTVNDNRPVNDKVNDNFDVSFTDTPDNYADVNDNTQSERYFGPSLGSHTLRKKKEERQGERKPDLSFTSFTNGSSAHAPVSFTAKPGESVTVAELQARRDQEQNDDVGEV